MTRYTHAENSFTGVLCDFLQAEQDSAVRSMEQLMTVAQNNQDALNRVNALAVKLKSEHGQLWNSVSGQRLLNALAEPTEREST